MEMHVSLKTIDRYLLFQILTRIALFTAIALVALLLERMLRIFDLALRSDHVIADIGLMLINLLPHYLGLALPAAFFFAVLLTTHRMCESLELTVMQSAGMGLQRLLKVSLFVGVFLTILIAVTVSLLQPYSRYTFRAIAHDLASRSLIAVSKEGAFVAAGNYVFRTGKRQISGDGAEDIFLFRETKDGNIVVITASQGLLEQSPDQPGTRIVLRDGSLVEFNANSANTRRVDFEQYQWQLNEGGNEPFRARGKDERELTLFELFANLHTPTTAISAHRIGAELHNNLVRVVSILFLPFLAIPLGMTNLRIGQAWGIGAALVVLITYEKVLQLGESLGAVGVIPAWSGAWPPVAGLAIVSIFLFRRAAYTASEPPIVVFSGWANDMYEMLANLLRLQSR